MYNRNKLFLTITSILVFIGISYAYFEGVVHGTGNTNAEGSAHTATIEDLILTGTTEVVNTNMVPGEASTYSFTIENPNDFQVCFGIYFDNVVNSFVNTSDLEVFLNGVVGIFPSTGDTSTIVGGFRAPANSTTTYTIIISYKDVEGKDQTGDIGKTFSGIIKARATECAPLPSDVTLARLHALNPDIALSESTNENPRFKFYAPQNPIGSDRSFNVLANTYVTYADSVSCDDCSYYQPRFTLINYTTCLYSECYENLVGKYAIDIGLFLYSSNPTYTTGNRGSVIKITNANQTTLNGVQYSRNEFCKVQNGNFASQLTGIYAMDDDYGPSYYFRGSPTNNYVKFGKWQANVEDYANVGDDMYWRIIRINGDGSIRMIYDGTRAYSNESTENEYDENDNIIKRSIGMIAYNSDGANIEYMYDNNTIDSNVKDSIDTWYRTNLTNNTSYIEDTLFCNDRAIAEPEENQYETFYEAYVRLEGLSDYSVDITPTFKCAQKNDRYTVSDTTIGNGALTYPVGLITADEVVASGASTLDYEWWTTNYLNTIYAYDVGYWTMTPYNDSNIYMGNGNGVEEGDFRYNNEGRIRPVINLKGDAIIGGTGTALNPFIVTNN